ncbi:prepilin-type N-terminal cleavage/methylation domain-containing protein [Puniceicoccus vermicola]|uniref:Prepilin-type N-terminal cleavage/methylation domain-containing protein n=1 Tax=Puniceicoccus vermicola TaxID=388746 RepID=A0A7X1E5S1_9BACT|nr:prepilin-type N-terminal cleavage/methylation domain-containing protein [Puniceicoccus vermicola]MBC2603348.1 prepilin-type N-terminal cleavage/methylation domain-containing protein [Puniceicoccus vermicola]
MTHRSSSKTPGFSLIELLVVIAVLGILAAILVPAIQSVRENANSAKCSQNLRQLAMGSQLFGKDHDGMIVPWRYRPKGDNGGTAYWEESLSPYLDIPVSESKAEVPNTSVLLCPTEQENGKGETVYFEDGYHTNYSINLHIAWNQPGNPEGKSHPVFKKGYFHRMTDPAKTYLFIDLFGSGGGGFWMGPNLVYPHQGRVNVAYVDGHVEAKTEAEMQEYLDDPKHIFWMGTNP